ncbi:MAG: hypothetical protein AAF494_05600 [Pseudomonadota bacterium]
MKSLFYLAGFVSATALVAGPSLGQETDDATAMESVEQRAVTETGQSEPAAAPPADEQAGEPNAPAGLDGVSNASEQAAAQAVEAAAADAAEALAAAAADAAKPCELHVWPTENYIGVKMGLLSGFGIVGAVLDAEGNEDEVKTVKDLMRDYLGPEIQLTELEKLDYMAKLKLDPAQYRVIIQDPTPWNEDVKEDEELKAEIKALNKKIKRGERITDSTNTCYAELITTHIFYHKAMMYGSNLFTGWNYRHFDGDKITIKGKGQVKNPLEEFPPKTAEMVETAKLELRDAYAKDFVEWTEKKVKR